ncbi:MAG: 50S ribosomal protein L25 [Bdellovibrio sp. SCN 50-8]|nr:MAG: 50S ribosomal protein L25 [Bdellovibrio sp. SCN 50-8]
MSTQRFDLNVTPRQTGKHFSRGLRNSRQVPAVVYGSSYKNRSITLEEGAILKYNVRAFENALFNLKSDDKELNNVVVLIKEVNVHPLTRRPQHVDLFALDLKKAVRISVELRIEGKPAGIADGGLLNVVNRQIEIECLPTEIPESITVDVSALGVGDSVHVSDLTLPAGVKLISSPDMTVAVCNILEEESTTPAAADAAAAPAAGAAAPAAAAPAAGAKK